MPRAVVTRNNWRGMAAVGTAALVTLLGCHPTAEPPAGAPPSPPATTRSVDLVDATKPLPPTVQEYADATVAAWAAPDLYRLARLTTPDLYEEMVGQLAPPELVWSAIGCQDQDGDPDGDQPGDEERLGDRSGDEDQPGDRSDESQGTSDCSFFNLRGDLLVLTVAHQRLGQPGAAVEVALEPTRYPEDPVAYVTEFITAWQDGNRGRMRRLAAAGVAAEFARLPAPPDATFTAGEPTGTARPVTVTMTGGDSAITILVEVSPTLLGAPRAIRSAQLDPP